jgi:Rrf2 family protein
VYNEIREVCRTAVLPIIMKITSETDYALRILRCLGQSGDIVGSKTIAEQIAVPERFTLKILRKLMISGFVGSKQGPGGGYFLARSQDEITVLEVVEAVDGPILVNKCLSPDYECTRSARLGVTPEYCYFHCFICRINEEIRSKLSQATIAQAIEFEEKAPGSAANMIFGEPNEKNQRSTKSK